MIFYVGYYEDEPNLQNRKVVLSAVNKMRYIIEVLDDYNIEQEIVSVSPTLGKIYCNGELKKYGKNGSLKKFCSFGCKNKLIKLFDFFSMKIQLTCYLLKNCKMNDTLLVYHSPAYCLMIPFIKRIKKCNLIVEMEEMYSLVSGNKSFKKKEIALCDKADGFIFPTKMLSDEVNKNNKPYVVIHGAYHVEKEMQNIFNDDKIHVVYAGTFDRRKGAATAVAAAEFLPENYHIHILGFGTEEDKQFLLKEIERVSKLSGATVSMDGLLSGEEYIRFIQSCDIGLSPQNPDADFNTTSFPSKILSYMANGLRVVSIRIPAIETSAIGKYMYYYDTQTPEKIADAIRKVDIYDDYNGRKLISDLDKHFKEEILLLKMN